MSIRKVKFAEGEFYHLYNRGNSKQKIYKDKNDYARFLILLALANSPDSFNFFNLSNWNGLVDFKQKDSLVDIGAYCLMPNHFHILLTPKEEFGVSKFMQKLTTAYVMYYNQKYERTGGLFEGKFKSQHIDNTRYLKYIFSYIHLNPVKLVEPKWREQGIKNRNKVLNFLKQYHFSSYLEYREGGKKGIPIINKKPFPKYFPTQGHFDAEIFGWLNYHDGLTCEARPHK